MCIALFPLMSLSPNFDSQNYYNIVGVEFIS